MFSTGWKIVPKRFSPAGGRGVASDCNDPVGTKQSGQNSRNKQSEQTQAERTEGKCRQSQRPPSMRTQCRSRPVRIWPAHPAAACRRAPIPARGTGVRAAWRGSRFHTRRSSIGDRMPRGIMAGRRTFTRWITSTRQMSSTVSSTTAKAPMTIGSTTQ